MNKLQSPAHDLPAGFFAMLTAEAWMDPELADLMLRDKSAAVARFAGERGFGLPAAEAIDAFELPLNPIGDVEMIEGVDAQIASPDATMASACGGCTFNCATAPMCPSQYCYSNGCSTDCTFAACFP